MKNRKKSELLIFIIIFKMLIINYSAFSQNQQLMVTCNFIIQLEKKSYVFKASEPDKQVNIIFVNLSENNIKLPDGFIHYFKNDSETEIFFEVKIKKCGKYYIYPESNNDIDYNVSNRDSMVLQPQSIFNFAEPIYLAYNFDNIGHYKLRVILRMGKLLRNNCIDAISPWVDIYIK